MLFVKLDGLSPPVFFHCIGISPLRWASNIYRVIAIWLVMPDVEDVIDGGANSAFRLEKEAYRSSCVDMGLGSVGMP